jgi:hypothetical protein
MKIYYKLSITNAKIWNLFEFEFLSTSMTPQVENFNTMRLDFMSKIIENSVGNDLQPMCLRSIWNINEFHVGCWWLTPVILATQQAGIRRIAVWSQPRQIVCKTLSQIKPLQKRTGGVAQGEGPGFKPQYHTHTHTHTHTHKINA